MGSSSSSLPPCLVFSCTPHCPPPPPPSLGSNEADEARSKMTSYFLRPQENDARCGGGDNLMYGCKWASDGELMCCSGQEGADLTSRCITLVPPLLMVTTHLYFLLPIGHLPVGRTRRKTKTNLPFSGFVHDLDNMTSLHIFEFLEKFGKLIQFGGGGRPLVIQIITLDVSGLFCPSKQMPRNSHPTKMG